MSSGTKLERCAWVPPDDALYAAYHDEEWGRPVHDDRVLFEFLVLEGAQAGLSWRTVLGRRDGYRAAFADFDPAVVASFGEDDVARLLGDPGVIRHEQKIRSAISNAACFLQLAAEHGSYASWLWGWVDGTPLVHRPATVAEIPAQTELSRAISRDLKQRGFRFVGPTIVYAYLQAVGVVDDHTATCFRSSAASDVSS